ncbi:hypothetical protein BB559_005227 [Furculomyces boomerangus]|uniref:Uncharacterized protein n=1 Tax=Furculomyces boomerangus TaxID=61424 RepID=A0A2T9Y9W5_9FUNG|nr:hypothetical protein BB559_005227 [Furculomyces boomerangus]
MTSSMTSILTLGSNLGLFSEMDLDVSLVGLGLATMASLGSSAGLIYLFHPFVTKILIERSNEKVFKEDSNVKINTTEKKLGLPNFKQIHKEAMGLTGANTEFTDFGKEGVNGKSVEVGPFVIDGKKQILAIDESTQLTLLTPSFTGLGFNKTRVKVGELQRSTGGKVFRTWKLANPSNKPKSILDKIHNSNLSEFTVIWRMASTPQERQVMSQINKLIN